MQIIQRFTCIGTLVHNAFCVTLFAYHICTKINQKRPIFRIEWLSAFSLLTIFMISISVIFMLNPIHSTSICCIYIVTFSTIAYASSKWAIYNFFLERLFIVNNKSSIGSFSSIQKQLWRIFLCFWFVCQLCFCLIFGQNSEFSTNQKICHSKFPPFVLGIVSLGDLIISLTISILLCRALLIRIHQNCEHTLKNEYILLKKFVLLSVIAVGTSQLSLMMTVICSFGSLWLSLDSAINAWCILLTFGHNKRLERVYNGICGRCHGCCAWNHCLLCFACNCCCSVVKITDKPDAEKKTNAGSKSKENAGTVVSSINADGIVSTAAHSNIITLTQMDIKSKTEANSGANSIKARIQSTIKLCISNNRCTDEQIAVECVNAETNVVH